MPKSEREKRLELAMKKILATLILDYSDERLIAIAAMALYPEAAQNRLSKAELARLKKAYKKHHPRA